MLLSKSQSPDERFAALKARLNGAKTVAPLVQALLDRPGVASEPEILAAAVNEILALHRRASDKAAAALYPEATDAVRALLSTPVADITARAWKDGDADSDRIAQLFVSLMERVPEVPETRYEHLPAEYEARLSEGAALSRLAASDGFARLFALPEATRTLFVGRHAQPGVLEAAGRFLSRTADRILNRVSGEISHPRHLSAARQSIVKAVAGVYIRAFETEFDRLRSTYRDLAFRLSPAARERFLNDLDLEESPLLEAVENTVARLMAPVYPGESPANITSMGEHLERGSDRARAASA